MKLIVTLVCGLFSGVVAAGTCGPVPEYGQVKDKAKTRDGRESLAMRYCLNKRLRPLQQYARDQEECSAYNTKILDALDSANDKKAIDRALGGCPDVFGAVDSSPPAGPVYRCKTPSGALEYTANPTAVCADGSPALQVITR